jgi:hypothetical protein
MDRAIEALRGVAVSEFFGFLMKSALLLSLSGGMLYFLLAAPYPPIHDALHHFRHSLAIVPCH